MKTLLETAIKQSDLLNSLVLDFNTAKKVGRVKKLWLDIETHQIIGMTCNASFFKREKIVFTWDKITSIGKDSILVNLEESGVVEQPEIINNVIGLEVWTDAGNKAGKLVNYCLDPQTGAVVAYLYTSNGWKGITDGIYTIDPAAVKTFGIERVIVTEASIKEAQQYEESLNEKIQHAKEFIQEDFSHTQADFAVAVQNTQGLAAQLRDKAQQATGVAKEKLSDTACQLQKTTQELSSQAKEKLAEFKDKDESVAEEDQFDLYPVDLDEDEETSSI